jgi:hypothetical protein
MTKVSKRKERGCKLNIGLQSAQLSPLLPLPLPSEFCNDENNNVIRLAMDALRNKKITLLTVTVFFVFGIFQFDFGCTSYRQEKN